MARYGKEAQEKVKEVMEEFKEGSLKSGKKVTSRKQAVAIGLSEARQKGAKVHGPRNSRSSRRSKESKETGKHSQCFG
jgi:hypothetical protein